MKIPNRYMTHNLRFTRTGTVWADFILSGLRYGLRPDKDKQSIRQLHQGLFRGLPGDSLLLGISAGLDPAAIVDRMLDGVDIDQCPDWVEECQATMATLDAITPGERVFWLSVPLAQTSGTDRVREYWRAAKDNFTDEMGLPRGAIGVDELNRRLAQARRVQENIPAPFDPTPATTAQMVWLHNHCVQRGLWVDPNLPTGRATLPKSASALISPIFDEGGHTDETTNRLNAFTHRYLKVLDPGDPDLAPSYQVIQAIANVPDREMVFPGNEIIGRLDESGIDVDWAIRLTVRSGKEVTARNQRALANLNDQFQQRSDEMSHAMDSLGRRAEDLAEYASIFDSDKLEVETQATIIMAVGAPDPELARAMGHDLAQFFAASDYRLLAPLGNQEELWWAMQPGHSSTSTVREFAQITTSANLASLIPFASNRLGDKRGSLLGINIGNGPMLNPTMTCGPSSVVLHDLDGASDRNVSGSLAVAGELGAGKALPLDTLIATPQGWTTMGQIRPGDMVFDESGTPTKVLAVSPVMVDHDCYRVEFSDGSSIVADAEHLWTTVPDRVRTRAAKHNWKARQKGGSYLALAEVTYNLSGPGWWKAGETSTTEQLRENLRHHGQANHAIPVCGALDLPFRDLPIDPYVLGAWLGDGSSSKAVVFSADPEVALNIEMAGYIVTKGTEPFAYSIATGAESPGTAEDRACQQCGKLMAITRSARVFCCAACAHAARKEGRRAVRRSCCVCGKDLPWRSSTLRCRNCATAATFHGQLSQLGLLNNKHIPSIYLRSSIAQRQALLAGLLDTDGTVSPGGAVEYATTSETLSRQAWELACSLGYRATRRSRAARLNGKNCGTVWTISFTTNDAVFCLERKAQALRDRKQNYSPARNSYRYITAIVPVQSVPVRCIRVEAESHLYLAGEAMIPTHNTACLMKLSADVRDRGGQLIISDRTQKGEWASWASSIGDAVVVNIADPEVSLDPLRLFDSKIAARAMQTFLTPLLNIPANSEKGILLSEVLDHEYLVAHNIGSAGELITHLHNDCGHELAVDLARAINVYARKDFGRMIFDATLPAVDMDASAIIVRTHTLSLPSREDLQNAHLFEQMGPERIFGRAFNALVAAIARHICFRDTSKLAAFVISEVHAMTASPEGERELVDFVRDGRKHRALLLMDSHDPLADFGSPTLRGLIPTRILMRHSDKALAQAGLEWLGLDPDDEDLIEMVMKDTSPLSSMDGHVPVERRGEATMRDINGNIGRVKILLPSRQDRFDAITAGGTAAKRTGSAA